MVRILKNGKRYKALPTSITETVKSLYNYRCAGCGMDDAKNLQADHVIPRAINGPDTLDNLQALCGHCNNVKGKHVILRLEPLPPAKHVTQLERAMRYAEYREKLKNAERIDLNRWVKITRENREDGKNMQDALAPVKKARGEQYAEKVRKKMVAP